MPSSPERKFEDEKGVAVTRESPQGVASERSEWIDEERPAPRHVLDDPVVQAKVQRAVERVRAGEAHPGRGADDLLRLADEQRRVDT